MTKANQTKSSRRRVPFKPRPPSILVRTVGQDEAPDPHDDRGKFMKGESGVLADFVVVKGRQRSEKRASGVRQEGHSSKHGFHVHKGAHVFEAL